MENEQIVYRTGMIGAAFNVFGILFSGPVGMGIELLVKPSPTWRSSAAWAQYFHPIQVLPYAGELVMILSFLVMLTVLHRAADEKDRTRTLFSLILGAVFGALAVLNNIAQTTFLPMLARHYNPDFDALIFTFSLANPKSFAWAVETWAYALLGLAFWIAAPVFNRSEVEKITAALMVFHGVVSLGGGLFAVMDIGWVWETPGLLGYMGWNVVVLAQACLFWLCMRRRQEALLLAH